MHGKGSLAALLLVVALAVPPTLLYRSWSNIRQSVERPAQRHAMRPKEAVRAAPAKTTAPTRAKVAAPEPAPIDFGPPMRDPMLSPADVERLKPKAPEPPAPPPVSETTPVRRPRPPRLSVEGVISLEGQARRAIVNGREVSAGSIIGRAKVLGIESDGVVFKRQGKTFKKVVGD